MKRKISEIIVDEGRRPIDEKSVSQLMDSIRTIGLLNPITTTKDGHLIAGGHRLEAAKRLGWKEIECNVMEIFGLQAELAEIDENLVRHNLNHVEEGEQLLRRKEIYEALYPKTKAGAAQGEGMKRSANRDLADLKSARLPKTFAEDTAEKMGITAHQVRRKIQIAQHLTPDTKKIVKENGISEISSLKLARINEPEKQKEVAERLARHEIKTVEEALPPKPQPKVEPPKEPEPVPEAPKREPTTKELLEEARNPNIPRGYDLEGVLEETDALVENFCKSTKRLLVENSTILADAHSKREVAKVLEKATAKINELKEIMK